MLNGQEINPSLVKWNIFCNTSRDTKITEDGKLVIGNDEKSINLLIIAKLKEDENIQVNKEIEIKDNSDLQENLVVKIRNNEEIRPGDIVDLVPMLNDQEIDSKDVLWDVYCNTSMNTLITEDGKLIIAKDEKSINLLVMAKLKANKNIQTNIKIVITQDPKGDIIIRKENEEDIKPGNTTKFKAIFDGEELENELVVWEVSGNNSSDTKIDSNGQLIVGKDETSPKIIIVAKLKADETVKNEIEVDINGSKEEFGYIIENKLVSNVQTKTPYDDFIRIFKNNNNLNIVVLDNGKEVKDGFIHTGMKLDILDDNNNVVDEFDIVVKGDINGDGYSDSYDSVLIKAVRMEVSGLNLTKAQVEACDINSDDKINRMDSRLSLYHRAGVDGYSLDYVQSK